MENANLIALISAIISGLSLLITIVFNIINQFKIIKDNEPQLAFSLKNFDGKLLLLIENKGFTKAKNIKITINKIHNNGNCNLQEDFIFNIPFELAPSEKVQGMIALLGGSLSNHVFPFIDINVYYEKPHFIKKVKYDRQVFYTLATENKITVDTELDFNNIDKNINNLHKSLLRLANYFDGCSLAPFDELNILSDQHFQQDLTNALNSQKNKTLSRQDSIKKRITKK